MKRSLVFCIVFAGLLLIVLSFSAYGQEDPAIAQVNEILKEKLVEIDKWNFNARLLTGLAVTVGLLGALGGVLGPIKQNWAKIAVSLAGAAVTIITVVVNTVFSVDHHTYRKLAYDANQIVDEIRLQMIQLQDVHDVAKRNEIINNNVMEKFKILTEIRKKYAWNANLSFAVHPAYAGQAVPDWVSKTPKERGVLYFVGAATSPKPGNAERQANETAKGSARIVLLDTLETSGMARTNPASTRIVKSILDSSEVVNRFVTTSGNPRQYRSFCLLKIDLELAQIRLKILSSQGNITIPRYYMDFLKKKSQKE